jgi:hypothetical protein
MFRYTHLSGRLGFLAGRGAHEIALRCCCCNGAGVAGRNETVTNVWSAARLQGESLVEKTICANVFGLWVESSSPGQDELRACLSFKTLRSLKTIRNTRLRTRRCDCSFVVTYPVQTSVEKLQTVVVVVWESGSTQRFQAEGAFSTPLGCDGSVLVAAGEHSPGDAGQLVGHGDDDDVLVRSGVE